MSGALDQHFRPRRRRKPRPDRKCCLHWKNRLGIWRGNANPSPDAHARLPQTEVGSEQPFDIAILPGITALVSEMALARLTDYVAHVRIETGESDADAPTSEGEDEEEGVGEREAS